VNVFILLVLAVVIWLVARWLSQRSGLPQGQVVYTDTGAWGRLEKTLFSKRHNLTGKPDYLVRNGNVYIPVEVKSANAPKGGPYESHVYQVAAYCVLVEETYRQRPTHGLIKYADKTLAVDFTPQLESDLLELLDDIRADGEVEEVARSHHSAARCRACGFREVCGQVVE
jgi:CRISPR-associated exonuclease Cas4